MNLNSFEFTHLLDKIKERYSAACKEQPKKKEPKTDTKLYGIKGPDSPGELSIHSFLLANTRVQEYMSRFKEDNNEEKIQPPSAQHLYNRYLKSKEEDAVIDLKGIYEHIYFLLCDCENREEFFNTYPLAKEEVLFNMLYYSERDQKVNTIELTLTLTQRHDLLAAIAKAHDNVREKLVGCAKLIGDWWKIPTRYDASQRAYFMELAIHVGGTGLNDPDHLIHAAFIKALAYGISSSGHPLSFECVLVNASSPKEEQNRNTLLAKRFLNLRRLHFHTELEKDKVLNTMDDVETQRVPLSTMDDLPATYRILSYWNGQLIQSKFIIEEDFTATITRPEMGERKCLLSLQGNQHGTSLFVQALERTGQSLSTLTVVKDIDRLSGILSGAYCTGSLKYGPFVMVRDASPGWMSKDETAQKDETYHRLLMELQKIIPPSAVQTAPATQ